MTTWGRRIAATAACLASTVLLSSCAGAQDDAAAAVADQLLSAAQEKQGEEACSLLAPAARSQLESSTGRPCREAVLEEDLGEATTSPQVEVFDTMAQVRYDGETVFLSKFDGAWLVVAAACSPNPRRVPYDCGIQVS